MEEISPFDELEKYKTMPLYLDGRYFDVVFRGQYRVHSFPLYINIYLNNPSERGVTSNLAQLPFDVNREFILLRTIIQIVNHRNEIVSKHSNLLIILNDANNRSIIRFEPLAYNEHSQRINEHLAEGFNYILPRHQYGEWEYHPQPVNNIGLCVAYVIKVAYYYLKGLAMDDTNEYDILYFAKTIEQLYGPLAGEPDIEYGFGGVAGGALLGGLTGGLIGGAVGGPMGAGLGLGFGALGGAAIGSQFR